MRNIFLNGALPTLIILTLAFFATGCGQSGADVAKLEAEKNELKAQIAALKGETESELAANESESQPTSEDGDLEFKGKIAKKYEDSVEWWAKKKRPPKGAPNVIIFLLDDTGFAQIGSFGGLIKTPNIDKLAEGGLRYNNFHTTSLCSPSRATLMAGRNPHTIGLGSHALTAMGFPGYNAIVPPTAKSVANYLEGAGLRQLRDRQVGPYAALRSLSDRSVRSLAERRRLCTLLLFHGRRRPPIHPGAVG